METPYCVRGGVDCGAGPVGGLGGEVCRLGGVSGMTETPDGGLPGVWAETEFIDKVNGAAGSNSNAITPKDGCFIEIPFKQWCYVSGVSEGSTYLG